MGVGWSEEDPFSQSQPWQEAQICNTKPQEAGKTKPELPRNYEAIVEDVDSQIDKSCANKRNDQLCTGVLLNGKKKVDRESGRNSFMLSARELSVTWGEDQRYWKWTSLKETSDVLVDMAEILNVCWLEIHVKFETAKLTPEILYEVAFVIMLKGHSYGWDVPVNLRLLLPNGIKIERKDNLAIKRKDQ